MPMIQFVMFEIATSVTISSADSISRILISGNLDSSSWCLKGELVPSITPWCTQNQLLFCFPLGQIWTSFLPCTIFTAHIYRGKSCVWNLWGTKGRAGANHNAYCLQSFVFVFLSNSVYGTGSGGSSFWRLGHRWWHHEFSEWQLMVPPGVTGLSGWRPFVFGVIHMNCEIISNCEAFKLFNELKSIAFMESSECIRLYT